MAAFLRRRSLLTAALLATLGTLSACGSASSSARSGHAAPRPSATPLDPDTAARRRLGAAMTTLLAGYDTAAAHADLRRGLAAQLTALGADAIPHAATTPSATAAPSVPSPGAPSPSTPKPSDADLANGEAGLVTLCATALPDVSAALARLLASIGAGAAQRATQLGGQLPAAPTASATAATAATATDGAKPTPAELDALQAALGAEQATVFGYGVLGAQLSGGRRSQATADYDLHRARRDALEAQITAAGAAPHAAAAAYDLPFAVTDTGSARRLATLLETRLAAVYANAVQAGEHGFRDDAATQLRLAALRALTWGASPAPFPGL